MTLAKVLMQVTKNGPGKAPFFSACQSLIGNSAADAASHLFFAYLRSMSPDPARGTKGIIGLPISLQQLVQATEYPPEAPTLIFNTVTKVIMIVDVVSPTPYALLRRAKNFEYRDDDSALQQFAGYDDPVRALTDECRRVLKCISSINQSNVSTTKASTSLRDASWSRFEDVGFGAIEESDGEEDGDGSMLGPVRQSRGLKNYARSGNADLGRPTTPSWADFLSSGFTDENGPRSPTSSLLPPDKFLPPIQTTGRGQSSQSHRRNLDNQTDLEPGELASIARLDLDDSFWWVWISSLAGEEPTSRKAVFGRCALIETVLKSGRWMIMEEQVKGAAPEPAPGAYTAEKKGFLGFTTRRGRVTRRKSAFKKSTLPNEPYGNAGSFGPTSRANIAPDQHAKIQAAAVQLRGRNQDQERLTANASRRGRHEEIPTKTNSVMTLQPSVMTEASPAMKWASQYDKNEVRAKYLGNDLAGKGSTSDLLALPAANGVSAHDSRVSLVEPTKEHEPVSAPETVPLPKSPSPPPKQEPSTSRPPIPQPPQQAPLPKMPSPTPLNEHSSAQLPSPPPSYKVPETAPSADLKQVAESGTPASAHPALTALPEPLSPVVTQPQASPPSTGIPRKAVGQQREPVKLTKKRTAGVGIKGIFGSRRPRDSSIKPPVSSPTESGPAVAAARAALAGKTSPQTNGLSVHQATTQGHMETPSSDISKSQRPLTPPSEPIYQKPEIPRHPESIPQARAMQQPDDSANMRREFKEGENLSRVDSNERELADREFSTFDQGPLVEQPAYVPPGSPHGPEPVTPLEEEHPYHRQAHRGSTKNVETQEDSEVVLEPAKPDLTREISPVQDRWAQIRKNAVERAARQMEEQNRQSDPKTDDGETGGEESKLPTNPYIALTKY